MAPVTVSYGGALRLSLALAALALVAPLRSATGVSSRASDWPCEWTIAPTHTPAQDFPDGPILGNGGITATIGGSSGVITMFVTTAGFWGANNGTNASYPPLSSRNQHADSSNGEGHEEAGDRLGFVGCPADNCTIPVGMTIGGITIASPSLAGAWTAMLWLDNATAQVRLDGSGGSLMLTAWVSATTQLVMVELVNTGTTAIDNLNITTWANGNTGNVPITSGCVDATSGLPLPSCPASFPSHSIVTAPRSPSSSSSSLRPSSDAAGQTNADSAVSAAGEFVRKSASLPMSPLPIDGVIAWRPLLNASSASPAVVVDSYATTDFTVPATAWGNGKTVLTHTLGQTTFVTMQPAASLTIAATAAASMDPGVFPTDVSVAAAARIASAPDSVDAVQALYSDHVAWWSAFWNQSSIALDATEAATEGFWYSSLYALGSSSRQGQLVADLWAGFRTTDEPLWRSNPTMDYNQQALYSGMFTANHVEIAQPYYDFIDQQLAGYGPFAESEALGCPGGVHFSVDYGPFGLKLGVYGEPQAWGIFSNAAYAAMTYWYQFETTPLNTTWVNSHALPFLQPLAKFWQCRLVKTNVSRSVNPDGYQYWDVDDCTGDEGCKIPAAQRTNPMWGIVYITRLFDGLIRMYSAIGRTPDPAWADVLAHLPAIPTTLYEHPNGSGDYVPVLSWYGRSNYTNFGGQANSLHAVWPSELVSMSDPNTTMVTAAQNALEFANWGQDNSFSWVFSTAARVGYNITTTFQRWNTEINTYMKTNRLISFGGLCSDSLGAIQFVHDVLAQGQEGFIRILPAWPGAKDASFTSLRMKGAILVSADYVGQPQWAGLPAGSTGGVTRVGITTEVSSTVTMLSPWPSTAVPPTSILVCDVTATSAAGTATADSPSTASGCTAGTQVPIAWTTIPGLNGGPAIVWSADAGSTFEIYVQQ